MEPINITPKKSSDKISRRLAAQEVKNNLNIHYFVFIGNLIIFAICFITVYLFPSATMFLFLIGILGNGYFFGITKKRIKYLQTKYRLY